MKEFKEKVKLKMTPNVYIMMLVVMFLFIISNKIDKVLMLLGQ